MRWRCGLSLAFSLSVACGPRAMDADAGFDAGYDAGPLEGFDGSVDAPYDAGPDDLGSVTMAAMDLQADLLSYETALADVPPSTLAGVPTLELNLCAFGIDAIIGEDGLQTLALSDPTVRALADLEQTARLDYMLAWGLADLGTVADPSLIALQDAANRMRDALAIYHDELVNLVHARLADPLLPTLGQAAYTETFLVMATTKPINVGAFVETDASQEIPIDVSCPGEVPMTSVGITDEETGTLLAQGFNTAPPVATLPPDTTRLLRIGIDAIPLSATPGQGLTCIVYVSSRRDLRSAPQRITSTDIDGAASTARGNTIDAFFFIESTRGVAGVDPLVLDATERVLTMMDNVLAPVWAMVSRAITVNMAIEDLQRALRLYEYADAIVGALLASPELAPSNYDQVRYYVDYAREYIRLMMDAIRAAM